MESCEERTLVAYEHITLLEARTLLWSVRRLTRDVSRHGERMLVLGDNLGVVLAKSKGRAHSYELNCIIRRITMYCLASGVRLSVRWLLSEWNPADKPSREAEDGACCSGQDRAASSLRPYGATAAAAADETFQRAASHPAADTAGEPTPAHADETYQHAAAYRSSVGDDRDRSLLGSRVHHERYHRP